MHSQKTARNKSFDLEGGYHVIEFGAARSLPWDGAGSKWELEVYPFNREEHTGGCACITRGANGALGFKCHHHSCVDNGWHELRALLDGPAVQTSAKNITKVIFTYRDVPSVWDFEARVTWLIEDLIPEGAITLITGDLGHGKTIFATAMAGAIVTGGTFLNRQAQKRKVLYPDRENPLSLVKQHLLMST